MCEEKSSYSWRISGVDLSKATPIFSPYGTKWEVSDAKHGKSVCNIIPLAFLCHLDFSAVSEKLQNLSKLSCCGLAHLNGVVEFLSQPPEAIGIISECCSCGSLHGLLNHDDPELEIRWSPTNRTLAIYSLALTMSYLQDKGIVHGFLNSRNVFFDENMHVKISDYWISSIMEFSPTIQYVEKRDNPRANESFKSGSHSGKVDVFSWGNLVHAIITGSEPWLGMNSSLVEYGEVSQLSDTLPRAYVGLLARCLDKEPQNRPSFVEIFHELIFNDDFILPNTDMTTFVAERRKLWIEFEHSGLSKDVQRIEQIKLSADSGDAKAQVMYGGILERGILADRDVETAMSYYKRAGEVGILKLAQLLRTDEKFRAGEEYIECQRSSAELGDAFAELECASYLYQEGQTELSQQYVNRAIADGNSAIWWDVYLRMKNGSIPRNEVASFKCLQKSVDDDYPPAVFEFGQMMYTNNDQRSYGRELIERAAKLGSYEAQYEMSQMDDPEVSKDENLQYLRMAAANHRVQALIAYADEHIKQKYVKGNSKVAQRVYKEAADMGSAEAQYKYADVLYAEGGDKNECLAYYEKAMNAGNIRGMVGKGRLLTDRYFSGYDEREGMKLLKTAADANIDVAQHEISRHLANSRNMKDAIKYLKAAVDQGYTPAIIDYSDLLREGRYISRNVKKAVSLLRKAADNGDAKACFQYAKMQIEGDGVRSNKEEGIEYMLKAARYSYPEAVTYVRDLSNRGETLRNLLPKSHSADLDSILPGRMTFHATVECESMWKEITRC